jgi:hypothetical protein
MMDSEYLMFKVHHGDQINRENICTYVSGDVADYPDPFDRDKMSFIEVDGVIESYGYGLGDLIYYRLLSSDHDILKMVEYHIGHGLVELYLVSFGRVDVDVDVDVRGEEDSVDEENEEEYERQSI